MSREEKFVGGVFCMDGRGRRPIADHTGKHVDDVAGAGPGTVRGVAERQPRYLSALREQLPVSVLKHGSTEIWVSGHAECAGNPVCEAEHIQHMHEAAAVVEEILAELGDDFSHVHVRLIWTYPDENRSWMSQEVERIVLKSASVGPDMVAAE